jgi:glycine cleavage system aminomethyltransferase T
VSEFILCLQVVVGDIRAASYGHTLGGAVGLAMVSHIFPRKLSR